MVLFQEMWVLVSWVGDFESVLSWGPVGWLWEWSVKDLLNSASWWYHHGGSVYATETGKPTAEAPESQSVCMPLTLTFPTAGKVPLLPEIQDRPSTICERHLTVRDDVAEIYDANLEPFSLVLRHTDRVLLAPGMVIMALLRRICKRSHF